MELWYKSTDGQREVLRIVQIPDCLSSSVGSRRPILKEGLAS